MGSLRPLPRARFLKMPGPLKAREPAKVLFSRTRRGRQHVDDKVLFLIRAAILFRLTQRAQGTGAFVAIGAILEDLERIGLNEQAADLEIMAGDVGPEARAAAQAKD